MRNDLAGDIDNAEARRVIKSPEFYKLVKKYGEPALMGFHPHMAMYEITSRYLNELGIIGTLKWGDVKWGHTNNKEERRTLLDSVIKEYRKGNRYLSKRFIKEWIVLEYGPYNTDDHGSNLLAMEKWEQSRLEKSWQSLNELEIGEQDES